jgi:hypothetical protein
VSVFMFRVSSFNDTYLFSEQNGVAATFQTCIQENLIRILTGKPPISRGSLVPAGKFPDSTSIRPKPKLPSKPFKFIHHSSIIPAFHDTEPIYCERRNTNHKKFSSSGKN